jgi:hypothetical protein
MLGLGENEISVEMERLWLGKKKTFYRIEIR